MGGRFGKRYQQALGVGVGAYPMGWSEAQDDKDKEPIGPVQVNESH